MFVKIRGEHSGSSPSMLELDILIVGSSMSFSLSPEQLQPALDFIRAGDASGLDRWLSSHEGLDQTLVVSAGKGEGWVLSKLVTAVALNPAPAHRTALLEALDPVMSARRPGWASSWLSFMPEALTGPRDVVEYFLGKGVSWDDKDASGGVVWALVPSHSGDRAGEFLSWAHHDCGPWDDREEMLVAVRRALATPNAVALRALVEFGADLSKPVSALGPLSFSLSMVLASSADRGFAPFREVVAALVEWGHAQPDSPVYQEAVERIQSMVCPVTQRPLLSLLEEVQSQHLSQTLSGVLASPTSPSRPRRF